MMTDQIRKIIYRAILAVVMILGFSHSAQAQIKNPSWSFCGKVAASYSHSSPTQEVQDWLIDYSSKKLFKSSFRCPDIPFEWSETMAAKFKSDAQMEAIKSNPQTQCERDWVKVKKRRQDQFDRGVETDIYDWNWINKAESAIRYNLPCPDFEQSKQDYDERVENWEAVEAEREAQKKRKKVTNSPQSASPAQLLEVCNMGSGEACVEWGLRVRKTIPEGQQGDIFRTYEKGCGFDDGARACTMAALGYELGRDLPQDLAKAEALYRRGCYELGHADGCMFLAMYFDQKKGDKYQALQANKMACRMGKTQVCDVLKAQGLNVSPIK